jgi:predicted RNA-binding protein Jag
MATYLQGVTDYIPDYQPFQPDFNFYANVLQTKQNQYDKNYQKINNLYADLYNAPVTHELNKEKKDKILKNIDDNLKKVANLDLSLEQNVNQATQVFRPFYEDKYLMKDMAWTKNAYNVLNRAQSLQSSTDEKMYNQFWPTGVKAINYRIQDFADATLDETMKMANVKYVPYENSIKTYIDMASKLKIQAKTKYNVDKNGRKNPYGDITITQKNGSILIPSLQEMFKAEYSKNPRLQAVYNEWAYVDRKDAIQQSLDKYNGDKIAAEKAYLQQKYDYITDLIDKQNQVAAENLKVTKGKADAVEREMQQGNVNPKQKAYIDALAGGATVQEAILMSTRKLNAKVNDGNRTVVTEGNSGGLNLENMDLARMKVDAAVASLHATKDINAAAKAYSINNYEYEEGLSKLGLERIKSAYRKNELEYKTQLEASAKAQQEYQKHLLKTKRAIWKPIDPNNPLKGGYIAMDETYDKTFRESSSDPGSTTEKPVNIAELNKEELQNAEGEYTDSYIDNVMMSIKELMDMGDQIKGDEWVRLMGEDHATTKDSYYRKLLNETSRGTLADNYERVYQDESGQWIGVNSDGSEVYFRTDPNKMSKGVGIQDGGFTDWLLGEDEDRFKLMRDPSTKGAEAEVKAKEKFEKLYELWSTNKTEGRKRFKYNTHLTDGFKSWLSENPGHEIEKQWSTNPMLQEAMYKDEQFHQIQHANEKIYERNSNKLVEGLEIALRKNFSSVLSDEQIKEIATSYKEQYFDAPANTYTQTKSEEVPEYFTIDGVNYAGPDVQEYIESNILPDLIAKSQRQSVGKIKKGTEWNETDGLNDAQWAELNTFIDSDPEIQQLEESYGLVSEPDLITTSDYWDLPRGEGMSDLADKRDKLAKEWRNMNNAASGGSPKEVAKFAESVEDVLSKAYSGIVYDPNSETGLLSMISGLEAGVGGKASLAADKEYRYVNLQDPASEGFRQLGEIVNDLYRINFNQVGNYKVSTTGLRKTDADKSGKQKHDINPDLAAKLVENFYQTSLNEDIDPIKISNSRIAMEDRNTDAVTIFLPRKYLEDNIKLVPYQGYEGELDDDIAVKKAIEDIMTNGLTFIAPDSNWQNSFVTTNKMTPLEMTLNALGSIEYNHPYNSGKYAIRKVSNVPGATHMGTWSLKGASLDANGKPVLVETSKSLVHGINRTGSTIEDIQNLMFQNIAQVAEGNQKLYEKFFKENNEEGMKFMQDNFGFTPMNVGFVYK